MTLEVQTKSMHRCHISSGTDAVHPPETGRVQVFAVSPTGNMPELRESLSSVSKEDIPVQEFLTQTHLYEFCFWDPGGVKRWGKAPCVFPR